MGMGLAGIRTSFLHLNEHQDWFFSVCAIPCRCPVPSSAINSETQEEVAIGNPTAFDNRIDAKRTLREIKLLRHMDHENVSPRMHCAPFPRAFETWRWERALSESIGLLCSAHIGKAVV